MPRKLTPLEVRVKETQGILDRKDPIEVLQLIADSFCDKQYPLDAMVVSVLIDTNYTVGDLIRDTLSKTFNEEESE